MRIAYLELRNYRRFRDLRLQFPDGIVGILGLNGSGKSTIIEAIAWALFGNVDEVVRTNKESIRRLGAKTTDTVSAVLEFEIDGTEYRLEREMGGKSLSMKAVLRTRNEVLAEGDRAVRSMVQGLIGMDHKSFFTSVFARQKELNELQNYAPAERKKVVLRMLRIDSIDAILQSVRDDRKGANERIRGAENVLLDPDGREKEPAIEARLKELSASREKAERDLKEARGRVSSASDDLEKTRERRDSLRKEVEAYNTAVTDLRSKESTIAEKVAARDDLNRRIEEMERRLARLPELAEAEKQWGEASDRKEAMEKEKSRFEKRAHLLDDISKMRSEIDALVKGMTKLRASRPDPDEVEARIRATKDELAECERRGNALSGQIGELSARLADKRDALGADRLKLEEIEKAGEDGVCPTCERKLDDAYPLLVEKLNDGLRSGKETVGALEKELEKARSDQEAVRRKAEALEKRKAHQEELLGKAGRIDAALEARDAELEGRRRALAARERELAELGEVSFSPEEYARVTAAFRSLKPKHDEYIQAKGTKDQHARAKADLEGLEASIKRHRGEDETLRGLAKKLEPNKEQYNRSLKEFDSKSSILNDAKDAARDAEARRERVLADIESAERELDGIRRMRESIEAERKRAEELALLEEVVAEFKGRLIGRIAPTLGEMTSEMIETMTDGKYTRAELDDDYQIMIDDDGELHSLDRFSGGEADLANLGLRLAISRVIADRTGANPMNILILDEVFGSLDPQRKRSVMIALSGLSTQFRQVMLITHVEDMRDMMSNVIRVEELPDGTSSARVVS